MTSSLKQDFNYFLNTQILGENFVKAIKKEISSTIPITQNNPSNSIN